MGSRERIAPKRAVQEAVATRACATQRRETVSATVAGEAQHVLSEPALTSVPVPSKVPVWVDCASAQKDSMGWRVSIKLAPTLAVHEVIVTTKLENASAQKGSKALTVPWRCVPRAAWGMVTAILRQGSAAVIAVMREPIVKTKNAQGSALGGESAIRKLEFASVTKDSRDLGAQVQPVRFQGVRSVLETGYAMTQEFVNAQKASLAKIALRSSVQKTAVGVVHATRPLGSAVVRLGSRGKIALK